MMKLLSRLAAVLLIGFFVSLPAWSQNYQEWEVFGGFDYLNVNAGSVPLGNGTNFVLSQGAYGWHGTLVENKASWIGGALDFSGDYANRTINFGTTASPLNVRFNGSAYPFLFGPRFYYRHFPHIVLFGEPLIGGVHARLNVDSVSVLSVPGLPLAETKWAYALGGGGDFKLGDSIALRFQADWIRSHFPETLARDYQNNYRLAAGIVFKFGLH